jgi:hypothetical protein
MSDPATQESVRIYNDAMDEIGANRIDAFGEDTPSASVAQGVFTRVSRFMLSLYPWSWQTARVPLSQLATKPESAYDYVYDLPGNSELLAVYDDRESDYPFKNYRLIGSRVHSDADELYADVKSRDVLFGITNWNETFKTALSKAIGADRCIKAGGTRTLKEMLRNEAQGDPTTYPRGGLIQAAAEEDGQQAPGGTLHLANGPLIDARR